MKGRRVSAASFSLTTMSLPPVVRFVCTVRARTSSKQISHAGIDSQLCLTPSEYFRGIPLPCLAPSATRTHARSMHALHIGAQILACRLHASYVTAAALASARVRADKRIRLVVTSMRRFDIAACHRRNTSSLRRRSFAAFYGLAVPARTPVLLSRPPQRCPSVMPPFPDARYSTPLPASPFQAARTAVLHR